MKVKELSVVSKWQEEERNQKEKLMVQQRLVVSNGYGFTRNSLASNSR